MDEWTFEGRRLKPHAVPVKAGDLVEGQTYFALNYADDAMIVPHLMPVVFVGRLSSRDSRILYFQDYESYKEGIRHHDSKAGSGATFYTGSENEVKHIFEFERALDVLLLCSIRRHAS